MTATKPGRYWTLITILLLAIIVVGGLVSWLRYGPNHPVEILLPPPQELRGSIYIGGNVTSPGFYPFTTRDNLETLIQTAGGTTASDNLSQLKLYILAAGKEQEPQKVNINRADVWLLEALPGIGKTLAQRIVDYRQQNGVFHNTGELLKVAGIGSAKYERIEHLITVAD